MKKRYTFLSTIAVLVAVILGYAVNSFAVVYVEMPKLHVKQAVVKKIIIPKGLNVNVSIVGKLTVYQVFNLLARETGISFNLTKVEFKGNEIKNYYFIQNKPLYYVMKQILYNNNFGYSYNSNLKYINIFNYEVKTFEIPGMSDLTMRYSGDVGSGNSSSNGSTGSAGTSGTTGTTGSTTSTSGTTSSTSNMTGNSSSSSSPGVSMSSYEGVPLYSYINNYLKAVMVNGKYYVEPKNGLIYLSGKVNEVRNAIKFLKKIKRNFSRTVFLKVELLNVALNKTHAWGINWNEVFNNVLESSTILGGGGNTSADISILAPLASSNNITPASAGGNAPSLTFSSTNSTTTGNNTTTNDVITALNQQGVVDVLSQPRLMMHSGQTRLISSGTIVNYLQSENVISTGVSSTTQTYPIIAQAYSGISVAFTPYINKNGNTTLTITLINNNIEGYTYFKLQGNEFNEPNIQSQTFTTTITIPNKKTMLVGGILQNTKTKNTYGVPILEDIPIIGNLFKSYNNSNDKNDLVIMITPEVVNSK